MKTAQIMTSIFEVKNGCPTKITGHINELQSGTEPKLKKDKAGNVLVTLRDEPHVTKKVKEHVQKKCA